MSDRSKRGKKKIRRRAQAPAGAPPTREDGPQDEPVAEESTAQAPSSDEQPRTPVQASEEASEEGVEASDDGVEASTSAEADPAEPVADPDVDDSVTDDSAPGEHPANVPTPDAAEVEHERADDVADDADDDVPVEQQDAVAEPVEAAGAEGEIADVADVADATADDAAHEDDLASAAADSSEDAPVLPTTAPPASDESGEQESEHRAAGDGAARSGAAPVPDDVDADGDEHPAASAPDDRPAPTSAGSSMLPEPDDQPPSAWSRLAQMGHPRPTKANLLAALLALSLGFAVVTQVRQTRTSGLENLRQSDLVSLLASVNNQSSRLDKDVRDLTRTRDGLKSGTDDEAAVEAARDRLASLGILAGTQKATGPGIKIVVNDPNNAVSAPNLLDTVQELRGSGAEAIQIGNVRVVANSWFGTVDEGGQQVLVVDGKRVKPPYTILAIGDSHTMSTAMAIPGGVVEQLKNIGAQPTVLELGKVDVTALRPITPARYAQRDDQGK
ncbi:DUF881 domain-containing protein [Luteipulveratus halotolerans]|nr:DUF881 domain-containing protein [Luteipulveratus halotolerans]